MGQVMGIIIASFSQVGTNSLVEVAFKNLLRSNCKAQRDPLENLRLAVERAEAAGVEQDAAYELPISLYGCEALKKFLETEAPQLPRSIS